MIKNCLFDKSNQISRCLTKYISFNQKPIDMSFGFDCWNEKKDVINSVVQKHTGGYHREFK